MSMAGRDNARNIQMQSAVPQPVLRPGGTCWRIEPCGTFGVLIDAADYFSAVRRALMAAQHQVLLIAWDFDTRIRLAPDDPLPGVPDRLGRFLTWLVRRRPGLRIHVLTWRLSLFSAALRGMAPLFVEDWLTGARLQYRLASDHPIGACHHQKLLVVDDALAFCGGIDMTADRWDTRAHRDRDPHRRRPGGRRYEPFHDIAAVVDGPVARALGELARYRWATATGTRLPAPPAGTPVGLSGRNGIGRHRITGLPVGIARTQPAHGDEPAVHEVEALWLAAIAAARHRIYIEAQYFAGRRIAQALMERLLDPDGPEIIILNPIGTHGWLEDQAMGVARDHLAAALRAADPGGRFGLYAPVTARGHRIYLHAKVLLVDDRLVRIGSSNINNRSMGLDTECDVAVELPPGHPQAPLLSDLYTDLVAEHLGRTPEEVRRTLARTGSLLATIEDLRRRPGRTLQPLVTGRTNGAEAFLVESELLDPERPRWPIQSLLHRVDWRWLRHRR